LYHQPAALRQARRGRPSRLRCRDSKGIQGLRVSVFGLTPREGRFFRTYDESRAAGADFYPKRPCGGGFVALSPNLACANAFRSISELGFVTATR
jgi:hypothetical protein